MLCFIDHTQSPALFCVGAGPISVTHQAMTVNGCCSGLSNHLDLIHFTIRLT